VQFKQARMVGKEGGVAVWSNNGFVLLTKVSCQSALKYTSTWQLQVPAMMADQCMAASAGAISSTKE
jgi:hypothetical protein